MVGVVSKTDIVSRIGECQGRACATMVATVMVRDVVYCRPDDSLQDVWNRMNANGLLNFPVVDERNRPLGVLNAGDLLHALLGKAEHEESLLRDYVMGIGYR